VLAEFDPLVEGGRRRRLVGHRAVDGLPFGLFAPNCRSLTRWSG
jgi:hypothetical protein